MSEQTVAAVLRAAQSTSSRGGALITAAELKEAWEAALAPESSDQAGRPLTAAEAEQFRNIDRTKLETSPTTLGLVVTATKLHAEIVMRYTPRYLENPRIDRNTGHPNFRRTAPADAHRSRRRFREQWNTDVQPERLFHRLEHGGRSCKRGPARGG